MNHRGPQRSRSGRCWWSGTFGASSAQPLAALVRVRRSQGVQLLEGDDLGADGEFAAVRGEGAGEQDA
ncbi:hypothetical protein [Streptomyces oceani]|uniref:Uncharacterized protein n=1 Tax=Streptomyces oceani TaxID=1075402 RepID=A0A1E7JWG9_9ACTN|nr:hypothetical protein [Streptomyces oceani]OEU95975.1 hypothetical protein AN216_22880 [Streptomyces oceani]